MTRPRPADSDDVQGRTVIVSDTHLGRPRAAARSADALRPLWAGARRLVLNGDVAEIHHPRHRIEAAAQTLRLHELCEADGVDVTMLSGNHDPFISDLRHLHLAAGLVFVTHGDVMHPAIAPWSPTAGRVRAVNDRALGLLRGESGSSLEARLRAAQCAAHVERQLLEEQTARSSVLRMLLRPWACAAVLHYWATIPRVAADFAAEHAPRSRYVVLGHTHRAGLWEIDGRVVVNTGSFGFPGRPRAVVIEAGRLAVHDVRRARGAYRLVETPRAVYPLDGAPSSAPAVPSARNTRLPGVRPSAAAT